MTDPILAFAFVATPETALSVMIRVYGVQWDGRIRSVQDSGDLPFIVPAGQTLTLTHTGTLIKGTFTKQSDGSTTETRPHDDHQEGD